MTNIIVSSFLCAVGFAAIHLLIGKLHFLDVIPRSRWLSFAGGVAVAYVFLHVLPELSANQRLVFAEGGHMLWVYVVALGGVAVFYGLERMTKGANATRPDDRGRAEVEAGILRLHMGAFGLYNLLIGYLLLHREEDDLLSLLFYFIAMSFHFLTNDFGLRQDHQQAYDRSVRWILGAAVLVGWGIGVAIDISETWVGSVFAFLAGGVILNVLKEELPESRQSRFAPFVLGIVSYGYLLLLAR